jgi:hypothetical protein
MWMAAIVQLMLHHFGHSSSTGLVRVLVILWSCLPLLGCLTLAVAPIFLASSAAAGATAASPTPKTEPVTLGS